MTTALAVITTETILDAFLVTMTASQNFEGGNSDV